MIKNNEILLSSDVAELVHDWYLRETVLIPYNVELEIFEEGIGKKQAFYNSKGDLVEIPLMRITAQGSSVGDVIKNAVDIIGDFVREEIEYFNSKNLDHYRIVAIIKHKTFELYKDVFNNYIVTFMFGCKAD